MNTNNIVVRAGVPQPSGALVAAAHSAQLPVLFSANAFARSVKGEFKGFNLTAAKNLPDTLDAALDSAGYVAAVRYGDYRWSVQEYYSLVASRKWAFHAAMDFCVEPPVASSLVIRLVRLEATAVGYFRCCNEASKRGLPMPMPVLQGWFPEDYVRCADMLAIQDWPDMVGIGSVCRRNVSGPDGIATIIETLDRILPKHVKFHLFGVKGGAVRELGSHHRFASIDSMAWDLNVRIQHRTGRTQAIRSRAMIDWQLTQSAVEPKLCPSMPNLGIPEVHSQMDRLACMEVVIQETVSQWYGDNLLSDHGYRETNRMALEQSTLILKMIKTFGVEHLADSSDAVEQAVFDALSVELQT